MTSSWDKLADMLQSWIALKWPEDAPRLISFDANRPQFVIMRETSIEMNRLTSVDGLMLFDQLVSMLRAQVRSALLRNEGCTPEKIRSDYCCSTQTSFEPNEGFISCKLIVYSIATECP